MDEETFRSGKHPDGAPVEHGVTTERNLRIAIVSLKSTIAILRARIAEAERDHDARVTNLLAANNREVERRREAARNYALSVRILSIILSKETP
jgi:ABC-type uncharacterized transport system ATPase subunit